MLVDTIPEHIVQIATLHLETHPSHMVFVHDFINDTEHRFDVVNNVVTTSDTKGTPDSYRSAHRNSGVNWSYNGRSYEPKIIFYDIFSGIVVISFTPVNR